MNKEVLLAIINSGSPYWDKMLLAELAKDKQAIPYIMEMLASEREEKEELITDLNFQLSRAHVGLENPNLNKGGFMQREIREFYKSGRIGHCICFSNR